MTSNFKLIPMRKYFDLQSLKAAQYGLGLNVIECVQLEVGREVSRQTSSDDVVHDEMSIQCRVMRTEKDIFFLG